MNQEEFLKALTELIERVGQPSDRETEVGLATLHAIKGALLENNAEPLADVVKNYTKSRICYLKR